ncbi:unnamed protein product, partial [Heterosigma akashiwo]
RAVQVRRLVVRDTVEGKLLALQERKKQLAQTALQSGKLEEASKLKLEDMIDFFK